MYRCLWRAIKLTSAMESRISNANVAACIPRFVLPRFLCVHLFRMYRIQDIPAMP
jgi:hypothetical protein